MRCVRYGLLGGAGIWLVIALALFLSACATQSPQSALFVACRSYTDTLTALQPLKPRLSQGEVAVINESIKVAKPLCVPDAAASPTAALDTVRAYLRQLVTIQQARSAP